MDIEKLAYWGSFAIPIVLVGLTGLLRKVVDGSSFRREHWYLGIDLTVYFFASTLLNTLDIAKASEPDVKRIIWTVVLTAGAVVMLFVQVGIHQSWQKPEKRGVTQLLVLCLGGNLVGILLLYAFVQLKRKGLV